MASSGKKKRVQRKTGIGSRRPPVEPPDPFDINAAGPMVTGDDGKVRQLPTLLESVAEMVHLYHRRTIVAQLIVKYGCSARTVDRALAEVREDWKIAFEKSREERVAAGMAALEDISRKALRSGKFNAARGARTDLHKLAGDLKPEVLIIAGLDRPADELLAQADEIRKKADEARKRTGG